MLTRIQQSKNFLECLSNSIKADKEGNKKIDAIELSEITSTIMPSGSPNFEHNIQRFAPIRQIEKEVGKKGLRLFLFFLVKNFCESINAVRNMTEDQMIETASFLLDECQDYSMEDYVCMFAMGKRGKLVKILDRVDGQIIGQMLNAYDELRADAKTTLMEKSWQGKTVTELPSTTPEEKQKENFSKAMAMVIEAMNETISEREESDKVRREESEKNKQNWLEKFQRFAEENNINIDDFKPKK